MVPGEKAIDEMTQLHQECARLQQDKNQASGGSSTRENTQPDVNPQSIGVSSRKKYVKVNPPLNISTSPSLGRRKCSSQSSTEGEKGEGKGKSGAGNLQTFIQDPDSQQDRVSSHNKGKSLIPVLLMTDKKQRFHYHICLHEHVSHICVDPKCEVCLNTIYRQSHMRNKKLGSWR